MPRKPSSARDTKGSSYKMVRGKLLTKEKWNVRKVRGFMLEGTQLKLKIEWILKPTDPEGTPDVTWEPIECWYGCQDKVFDFLCRLKDGAHLKKKHDDAAAALKAMANEKSSSETPPNTPKQNNGEE